MSVSKWGNAEIKLCVNEAKDYTEGFDAIWWIRLKFEADLDRDQETEISSLSSTWQSRTFVDIFDYSSKTKQLMVDGWSTLRPKTASGCLHLPWRKLNWLFQHKPDLLSGANPLEMDRLTCLHRFSCFCTLPLVFPVHVVWAASCEASLPRMLLWFYWSLD